MYGVVLLPSLLAILTVYIHLLSQHVQSLTLSLLPTLASCIVFLAKGVVHELIFKESFCMNVDIAHSFTPSGSMLYTVLISHNRDY